MDANHPNPNGPDGRGEARDGGRRPSRARDWQQLGRLLQQMPPHSLEAEMSLLGSILLEPAVISDVLLVLRSPEDFFDAANARIYGAMVEIYDRHAALDIIQLNQKLADLGVLAEVGGQSYLIELAEAVPTAANAVHYARLVRDKAIVRSLIHAAGGILASAYESPGDARALLEEAEASIFRIAQRSEQIDASEMRDLVLEVYRLIEEAEGKVLTGVPTAFEDLDRMTHGLQRGEMIILAARPSMGKTAFALNLAENMALAGHGIAVFSLEMSRQQLVQRLLSSRSGIDSQKLRRGMLARDDWAQLRAACSQLLEAPMFIDDTPGLTLMQLRAKARRLKAKHDIQAVVIDYLQLMSSGSRSESRQVEIGEISRGVKAMARELDVPVVCLSQLNRAAEQREGHRPRMSDLRESGSIEQDADVVMMLHREEYYHQSNPEWRLHNPDKVGVAELIIAKQRNGPTGTVNLAWISELTRFRDLATGAPLDPGGYGDPVEIDTAPSYGASTRSHFSAKPASGPVENFRDGGGS